MNNVMPMLPTVESIKQDLLDGDQMASQAIVAYCNAGEKLAAHYATMDTEKFSQWCGETFDIQISWAKVLMKIAHHRQEALQHDSVSAAYDAVKELPTPEHAKKKRGPKPGAENAGRPKGRTSWRTPARERGLLSQGPNATELRRVKAQIMDVDPTIEFPKRGGVSPENAEKITAACEVLAEKKGKKPAPVIPLGAEADFEDCLALLNTSTEDLDAAVADIMHPQYMVARGLLEHREVTQKALGPLSKPDRKKAMTAVVQILQYEQEVFQAHLKANTTAAAKRYQAQLKEELAEQKKQSLQMRKILGTPFDKKDFKFIRGVLHSDREVSAERKEKAFDLFLKLAPLFGEKP